MASVRKVYINLQRKLNDIAKAFSAFSRPVWEFLISLMAKQILLNVKLV